MKAGRKLQASPGFTLLEMLVAVAIGSLVMIFAYQLLASMIAQTGSVTIATNASNELEDLVDGIKLQFARRQSFTISSPPAPNGIFNQNITSPVPCQQQLNITQVNATLSYITKFVTIVGLPPVPANLVLHPDLILPAVTVNYPQFTVTTNGQAVTYPRPGNGIAMVICFRQTGNTISVEGSTVFYSGSIPGITRSRVLLSTVDRSNTITFLPPSAN